MKRILIVEDNRNIAGALKVRLRAAGYDAQMVYDGARALAAAVKYAPDLILMDIQMPGGLGFSIQEHLETLKIPETPIVFITASKKRGLRKSAREMGAAGFFEKPFDTQKLLDCIASTLKAWPAKKRNRSRSSSTSAPGAVGCRRILVLEDDRDIASALEVRLNAAGYEVWVARNGLVALELARSHQPDLLLSDVRMPMGFGCSIIEHLAEYGLPDLPVIFMTASKDKSLRQAAERLGAAGFFEKPYDPDTLLGAISNALNDRSIPARASN